MRIRKIRQFSIRAGVAYLVYLILLGPFLALDGRRFTGDLPERVRVLVWAPAIPLFEVPGVRQIYGAYLDEWYDDPLTETTE